MIAQAARTRASSLPIESRRIIPFDSAFRHALTGEPGRVSRQTLTVSVEAAFTAVSIGYGFVPTEAPKFFGPAVVGDFALAPVPVPGLPPGLAAVLTARNVLSASEVKLIGGRPPETPLASLKIQERAVLLPGPTELKLADVIRSLSRVLGEGEFLTRRDVGPQTAAALAGGIRFNPELVRFLLQTDGRQLGPAELAVLFETVSVSPEPVQFLYALADEGSGREFQSEPILSTAGLGSADGERPFRQFAQPITFAPRSVIRMDVTEVSRVAGTLHVSLHGYKVLGGAGSPTGCSARQARTPR
jgi:hypothetical protein